MAACALLSACGASSGGTGQARAEEKVLHIYNWADYIGKDTIAQFEARTGIKVIYDTYDSDDTLEAKMMAGDSGYDVVSTSTDYFARQIKAGIYQPLDKSLLPGLEQPRPADPGARSARRSRQPLRHALSALRQRLCLQRRHDPRAHAGCACGQPRHAVQAADHPPLRRLRCDVLRFCRRTCCSWRSITCISIPTPLGPRITSAAEQLLLAVRPYIKAFDSTEYMNGLAER